MCIHRWVYIHIHVYVRVCTLRMYTYVHIHIHVCTCVATYVHILCHVTTQMRFNANAIYQHLEKFDREKKEKSQSVRQDSNPLHSVPYIRAQPLGHHRCCCRQPLFQLFYRQTLHNPAPLTLTLLTIHNPAPPVHVYIRKP